MRRPLLEFLVGGELEGIVRVGVVSGDRGRGCGAQGFNIQIPLDCFPFSVTSVRKGYKLFYDPREENISFKLMKAGC